MREWIIRSLAKLMGIVIQSVTWNDEDGTRIKLRIPVTKLEKFLWEKLGEGGGQK